MNNDQFTDLSLYEASKLIQQREISPVELTLAHLERIEALNHEINCYISIQADKAMNRAQQAENELQRKETIEGTLLGPLHGLPIALKDLFETKGIPTTNGSKIYSDYVPDEDAEVVRRLKDAGAVMLGKNNMHEIALGLTTVNPHYGASRNPWNTERICGGSSGGSAAALASRMGLAAMGSDTGGSIRVPAALCGVVGLKPTFGRVSLRGVIPLSWHLDHAGPMARRVIDVAMMLQVLAGFDEKDPASFDIPVDDYISGIRSGVKGWRIAFPEDQYFQKSTAEILQTVRDAAVIFESLGANIEMVEFPGAYQAASANGKMVIADAAVVYQDVLRDAPHDFGQDVLQRLRDGAKLPVGEYILARHTQTEMRRQLERFFDRYDILLLPTTAVTAPLIEGPDALEQARLLTRYTAPFNLTGLPALSLPGGFDSEGLPIGLQLVSRPWAEAAILRAAYAYEQETTWHLRSPIA